MKGTRQPPSLFLFVQQCLSSTHKMSHHVPSIKSGFHTMQFLALCVCPSMKYPRPVCNIKADDALQEVLSPEADCFLEPFTSPSKLVVPRCVKKAPRPPWNALIIMFVTFPDAPEPIFPKFRFQRKLKHKRESNIGLK
jgi:hypothetical protein